MSAEITGEQMGLDETSRAIGRLEATQEATKADVAELKTRTEAMDAKLDRLLERPNRVRLILNIKHWAVLLAGGSMGGGGLAHLLRKIFG